MVKDSTVLKVHFGSEHLRQKARIADFLERLARHVRGDELEIEPFAVAIVLKGKSGHEVLHMGMGTKGNLRESADAFKREIEAPRPTTGEARPAPEGTE